MEEVVKVQRETIFMLFSGQGKPCGVWAWVRWERLVDRADWRMSGDAGVRAVQLEASFYNLISTCLVQVSEFSLNCFCL